MKKKISFLLNQFFVNFRTRIVAPDPSKETTQPEVNNYFVNDNGEVFSTTKPLKPTTTETKLAEADRNLKNFRNKKEYIPKLTKGKSVDLEPLLEEPLKDNFGSNNDDEVEVIQSKENQDDKETESVTEAIEHGDHNATSTSHDEEEYEDEEEEHHNSHDDSEYYTDDEAESIDHSNDIQSEGHHKHEKEDLHDEDENEDKTVEKEENTKEKVN